MEDGFKGSANAQNIYRKEDITLASYIEGPVFAAGPFSCQISLDSLLIGTEDLGIFSGGCPLTALDATSYYQRQSILSASWTRQ
jgi:elongator complex protein 2